MRRKRLPGSRLRRRTCCLLPLTCLRLSVPELGRARSFPQSCSIECRFRETRVLARPESLSAASHRLAAFRVTRPRLIPLRRRRRREVRTCTANNSQHSLHLPKRVLPRLVSPPAIERRLGIHDELARARPARLSGAGRHQSRQCMVPIEYSDQSTEPCRVRASPLQARPSCRPTRAPSTGQLRPRRHSAPRVFSHTRRLGVAVILGPSRRKRETMHALAFDPNRPDRVFDDRRA